MRHVRARALVLAVLAAQLGGCNSFLGIKFARSASSKAMIARAAASELPSRTPATDSGRSLLAAGLTGLAIESFQRALATGEPIAPAVNGLGVAYARIGRPDLAERFFEQAMAADPVQPRYADNLARLLGSHAEMMRRNEGSAAAIKAADPLVAAPLTRTMQGRLQRISRGEVRITTALPQAAPARSAAANLNDRFKPRVRISFADLQSPRGQPFVRIQLPESKAADTSKTTERTVSSPHDINPMTSQTLR